MKKLHQKHQNILKVCAGLIGLVIFAFMFFNPISAIAAIAIMVPASLEMTNKEELFLNHVVEQVKNEIGKFDKGYITLDKLNSVLTEKVTEWSKDMNDNQLKELNDALDKQGLVIQGLLEQGNANKSTYKSLGTQFKEWAAGSGKDQWEKMKASKSSEDLKMEVKSAANMIPSTNYTGNVATPIYEPGMTDVAREGRFIMDALGTTPTTSITIYYTEKQNVDGSATFIADTASFTQVDFDLVVSSSSAKDVGAFITVHENMLDDLDYIAGEIDRELVYQIRLAADKEVLSGTGLTVHLKGLTEYATAFSLTSIEVTNPSYGDAISAAIRQIEILGFNTSPSLVILLNPADYEKLLAVKDSNGQYVKHPLLSLDGNSFGGYPIYRTSLITAGNLLVADKMKVNTKVYKGIELATGYNLTGEFAKRLLTIRGSMRMHNYVKSNDVNSVVYDAFADIIAAITPASS